MTRMRHGLPCLPMVLALFVVACKQAPEPDSAEDRLQRFMAANDRELLAQLDRALNEGRYDVVVDGAREFIETHPESDQAWLVLGWAYTKKDELDQGRTCFEKALALNPECDNAHVGLGVIHRERGQNKQARTCYRAAIEIEPENPEALASLLVIELIDGRYDDAVACGEKAWAQRRDLAAIPANLAVAYHYQGNTAKRDHFYDEAQKLGYRRLDTLDDIFAGRMVIGDPPAQAAPPDPPR